MQNKYIANLFIFGHHSIINVQGLKPEMHVDSEAKEKPQKSNLEKIEAQEQ